VPNGLLRVVKQEHAAARRRLLLRAGAQRVHVFGARHVPDQDRGDAPGMAPCGLQVDFEVALAAIAHEHERQPWIGLQQLRDGAGLVLRQSSIAQ